MTNTSLFVPFISYKENKEMWIWPQVAFFRRNFKVNLHTLWAIYITFYYCKNSISIKCFSLHGTCANLLKNNFYSFSSMVEIKCELQVWILKEFSIKLEFCFCCCFSSCSCSCCCCCCCLHHFKVFDAMNYKWLFFKFLWFCSADTKYA